MIPIVIVLAVGIFGSGSYLNRQQKIARQEATQEQNTADLAQTEAVIADLEQQTEASEETVAFEDQAETVPADEGITTDPESQIQTTTTTNVDGTITVSATLPTNEEGTCTMIINQTQFTATAQNGSCEFKDLSLAVQTETPKITFTPKSATPNDNPSVPALPEQ
jgi:cytoskeletal protein RodZ